MDITARKLTEVELRRNKAHLTDAQRLSHTGSAGMEAGTKRMFWSEESARIYGYAPGTEPTPDLILERAGQAGGDFNFEHRLLMPDGSIKHIELSRKRQLRGFPVQIGSSRRKGVAGRRLARPKSRLTVLCARIQ
jgi:PAS domain-containing protein